MIIDFLSELKREIYDPHHVINCRVMSVEKVHRRASLKDKRRRVRGLRRHAVREDPGCLLFKDDEG